MKCTDKDPCAGMKYALQNPPREGMGLVYQTTFDLKTGEEGLLPVYYMRRSRRNGDRVLKVIYCPFCGEKLNYQKTQEGYGHQSIAVIVEAQKEQK